MFRTNPNTHHTSEFEDGKATSSIGSSPKMVSISDSSRERTRELSQEGSPVNRTLENELGMDFDGEPRPVEYQCELYSCSAPDCMGVDAFHTEQRAESPPLSMTPVPAQVSDPPVNGRIRRSHARRRRDTTVANKATTGECQTSPKGFESNMLQFMWKEPMPENVPLLTADVGIDLKPAGRLVSSSLGPNASSAAPVKSWPWMGDKSDHESDDGSGDKSHDAAQRQSRFARVGGESNDNLKSPTRSCSWMGEKSDDKLQSPKRSFSRMGGESGDELQPPTKRMKPKESVGGKAKPPKSHKKLPQYHRHKKPQESVQELAAKKLNNPSVMPNQKKSEGRNGSWNETEHQTLYMLLKAQRALETRTNKAPLRDVALWTLMSQQLQDFQIERSYTACKNYWSRFGRARSEFDERANPDSKRLSTSVQCPKKAKKEETTE